MGKGPSVPEPAKPIKTVTASEVSPTQEAADYQRKRNRGYNYDKTILSDNNLGASSSPSSAAGQAPKTLLGQ